MNSTIFNQSRLSKSYALSLLQRKNKSFFNSREYKGH